MDEMIKMAVIQTILDTLALLVDLNATASPEHKQRINEMVLRLTTMAQSI